MARELAIEWSRHSQRLWRCSAALLILLGTGLVFGSALNLKRFMAVSPELLINVLIALSLTFLAIALWRIRAGTERALHQREKFLADTLENLLAARDPDTLVRDLIPEVAAHVGADTFFNYMLDESAGALRLHVCAGIPEDTARRIERLEFGQAICGTVAQTRRAIVATDIQHSDYDKAALVRSFGIRTYACNPLLIGDRLLGTLSFASRTRSHFEPDELEFLRTVSKYVAVAIDRLKSLQALREAKDSLANQAAELERLVQERTAKLSETVQELEAFSYSVSHDLRAPLRHIGAFVQLIQRQTGSTLDPETKRRVNMIADSAREMGRLIDDLLAFARMGRAEMRATTTDLEPLVREVIHDVAPECEGRDIIWQIDPLPPVNADRALLRQVWVNLLSNALKYTRTRSRAEIQIGHQPGSNGEQIYFVRDNGVGFNMAYAQKLFGVFQRLHRAEEFEGTGIGLANVRRIISRHGGRTWAEAKIDAGATFYFSLPASKSQFESAPAMKEAA